MQLNPRHLPVRDAENDLCIILTEWRKRHDLTLAEELFVLTKVVYGSLGLVVKDEHEKAAKRAEKKPPKKP